MPLPRNLPHQEDLDAPFKRFKPFFPNSLALDVLPGRPLPQPPSSLELVGGRVWGGGGGRGSWGWWAPARYGIARSPAPAPAPAPAIPPLAPAGL